MAQQRRADNVHPRRLRYVVGSTAGRAQAVETIDGRMAQRLIVVGQGGEDEAE